MKNKKMDLLGVIVFAFYIAMIYFLRRIEINKIAKDLIPSIFSLGFIIYFFVSEHCRIFCKTECSTILKKVIVLLVLASILFIKYFILLKLSHVGDLSLAKQMLPEFGLFLFCIGGFFEEIIFKECFFNAVKRSPMPEILCIIIVSIIFALSHMQFNIIDICFFSVFQFLTLYLYKLYPNVLVFSIFHVIHNSILYLV